MTKPYPRERVPLVIKETSVLFGEMEKGQKEGWKRKEKSKSEKAGGRTWGSVGRNHCDFARRFNLHGKKIESKEGPFRPTYPPSKLSPTSRIRSCSAVTHTVPATENNSLTSASVVEKARLPRERNGSV